MNRFYHALILLVTFLVFSCEKTTSSTQSKPDAFIRVNATLQEFSEIQPWDRKEPVDRRGLGTLLENGLVLTTSEMVAHNVYLELESADGIHKIPARVVAEDAGANLALIEPVLTDGEDSFLNELTPIKIGEPLNINDQVETWQLEENGQPTITKTNIYAVDVTSTSPVGSNFFCYLLKGSLQSASNSYTVPVLSNGTLAGVLTSYDSQDQISEVVSGEIIKRFLSDAEDGTYEGFASLGIAGSSTEDSHFRNWLKLDEDEGGIYITKISKNSAAEQSGLQVGDVLMSINGHAFDRKGYYEDEQYGKLSWTHLIRGSTSIGETIKLSIKREGTVNQVKATLGHGVSPLVDYADTNTGSQYYIKGGIIFQELTKNYLIAHGKNWITRAPLNLLDIYHNPDKYESKFDEAVIITGVIPSQVTVGYEGVRNGIVEMINGKAIRKVADLDEAFQSNTSEIHEIILSEAPYKIYLDASATQQVDQTLLAQGLSALARINPKELAQTESIEESSTAQ